MRVGIQPYVWSDSMVMKWEYYRDREAIARQRDDGTYEPRSLPIGFELDPELPGAVPAAREALSGSAFGPGPGRSRAYPSIRICVEK